MRTVVRSLHQAGEATLLVGALALFAMMLHITADVLAKLGWNSPIIGTLEIVTYIYMVACTFLPLAHVMLSRSMIIVEAFTTKLSQPAVLRLDSLVGLLTFAYFAMIAVMSGRHAIGKTVIGEVQDATYFELPIWPMRWILVISCALAAAVALFNAYDDWRLLKTGRRFDAANPLRSGENTV